MLITAPGRFSQILHVQNQQSNNTTGGTATTGSYQNCVLNTVVKNTIPGASLSSNQPALPRGLYELFAEVPFYVCAGSNIELYNATDAAKVALFASNKFGSTGDGANVGSILIGEFETLATKAFNLRYRVAAGSNGSNLGTAKNFSEIEVFANVIFRKIR